MKLEKKDFTQIKYNELIDYANSNNSIIVDKGTYYETVKIEEPEITLEELKEEKIKQLDENCQKFIYSVYPIHKQLDIINPLSDYTEEDRLKMNVFINENRNICHKREELIEKAISKEELAKIEIEFKNGSEK